MDATTRKLMDIQRIAERDSQYLQMLEQHRQLDARYLQTISRLDEASRAAICDYLGSCAALYLQMLRFACG